jgi:hypothetical protein
MWGPPALTTCVPFSPLVQVLHAVGCSAFAARVRRVTVELDEAAAQCMKDASCFPSMTILSLASTPRPQRVRPRGLSKKQGAKWQAEYGADLQAMEEAFAATVASVVAARPGVRGVHVRWVLNPVRCIKIALEAVGREDVSVGYPDDKAEASSWL